MLFDEMKSNCLMSYYHSPIDMENLFCRDVDKSNRNCREFIEKYFCRGGKGSALQVDFFKTYNEKGKHAHTVSLYLLGVLLENLFKERLYGNVNRLIPTDDKVKEALAREQFEKACPWYGADDYKYSWFMTSLYHDVASCVEKIADNSLKRNCICTSILRDILSQNKELHRYSFKTVENYCKYRGSCGEQDHGIMGGILLYEGLMSIYKEKLCEGQLLYYIDLHKNLICRKEHLKHYIYVADAIVSHNMWTVLASDKCNADKYRDWGLEELVICGEQDKLSIEKHPLHFVLCLLDTIEPVKRFASLSAREVLENVNILLKKELDQEKVVIEWTNRIKEQSQFWDWMESISTMSNWMNVKVLPCQYSNESGNCNVVIEILK